MPPIRVETVEHQRIQKRCLCDTVNTGMFPAEVKCAVSYGPRLHVIGAYLLNVHYLPVARPAALFKDLFQLPVSTGWVVPGTENFPAAGRHGRIDQAGCHGRHGGSC